MPADDLKKKKLTIGRLYDSLFFSEERLKCNDIQVENFEKKLCYREGRKA
jgi:hypothetical protein